MVSQYIDLHTHSSASDGTDAPVELVRKAKEANLVAFALTDHDTVAGGNAAQAEAKKIGIECICGCEIAVHNNDIGEMHIVGLWAPADKQSFIAELQKELLHRKERNTAIIEKLQQLGYAITLEEVEQTAIGICGRPHIARVMVAKGYAKTIEDAFLRYLGKKGSSFVPRKIRPAQEGITLLVEAGATPILAHPCLGVQMTPSKLETIVKEYKEYGLIGIEAFHTAHDSKKVRLCRRLAKKYDLLVSGGSDYHGEHKSGVFLGYASDKQRVQVELLDAFKEHRARKGLPV